MIIIRQKEYARAISNQSVANELKKRGQLTGSAKSLVNKINGSSMNPSLERNILDHAMNTSQNSVHSNINLRGQVQNRFKNGIETRQDRTTTGYGTFYNKLRDYTPVKKDKKLYSTENDYLDDLVERAFCDSYEYAQKEFGNKQNKAAKRDYEMKEGIGSLKRYRAGNFRAIPLDEIRDVNEAINSRPSTNDKFLHIKGLLQSYKDRLQDETNKLKRINLETLNKNKEYKQNLKLRK